MQLIGKNPHIFIGLNFFLVNPIQSLSAEITPLLLPFFSIKVLTEEEARLLKLWKETTFSQNFFPADTQTNFIPYYNTHELFPRCTNNLAFYQMLLLQ